jgi:sulfite exporter TauE/SafE
MIAILVAGALAGLASSGHCVLMCGPLAVAHARIWSGSPGYRGRAIVLQQLGRIGMYVVLGVLAGWTGETLVAAGAGRWLAWGAAAALIIAAVAGGLALRAGSLAGRIGGVIGGLSRRSAAWTAGHAVIGPLVAGLLNGLLPCGLVYAALAVSLGLGAPLDSAAFMLAFGLATTPVLTAIALTGIVRQGRSSTIFRRLRPAGLVVLAVLLIWRGWQAPAVSEMPSDAGVTFGHHR